MSASPAPWVASAKDLGQREGSTLLASLRQQFGIAEVITPASGPIPLPSIGFCTPKMVRPIFFPEAQGRVRLSARRAVGFSGTVGLFAVCYLQPSLCQGSALRAPC